jgi:hypothetical protein
MKMKSRYVIFPLVLFSILIISGCSNTVNKTVYVCSDGKQVTEASMCVSSTESNANGVKCTDSTQCNGGYCVVDALNPSNNHCENPGPQNFCGNGVCEASRGETKASCPTDCS